MNYFSFKDGHLLTIMLPISFIISKVLMFLYLYYDWKFIIRIFNYSMIIVGSITSIIFYLFGWGEYFCFIWIGSIILSDIMCNYIYSKSERVYTHNINIFEIPIIICSLLWGIFVIVLPYTRFFAFIGGGNNLQIDILSKILFFIYGVVQIILDKPLIVIIDKFKR